MEPAREDIVIFQGVDWRWAALEAFDDGTIRNLDAWTGRWRVWPGDDYTVAAVLDTTVNAVLQLGLQGIQRAITTTSGAAAEGDTTVAVTSAAGMSEGDTLTVIQNEVSILWGTIAGIAGTTLTLSVPFTDATAAGATVQAWDPDYEIVNVLTTVDNSVTGGLTPWGVGSWQLDLEDPFGHEDRYWLGDACLQGGGA